MRFGAAFWIQRTDWPDLRDACLAVERAGWDSLWLDDHLLSDEADWADPKLEGWASLAAVSSITTRVRLGLLVSSTTFRNPGLIAKLATTLDHLSAGRAVLGLGGGWFEREHDAFGIDFGAGFGERLDRLDEATGVIRRLLDGERVTHDGPFYDAARRAVRAATGAGAPADPDRWVGPDQDPADDRSIRRPVERLRGSGAGSRKCLTCFAQRCDEIGRPFEAIERTVTVHAVVRDTAALALEAWTPIAERHGLVDRVGADGTDRELTSVVLRPRWPRTSMGIAEQAWVR